MARKRFTPEQIRGMLRKAEVRFSQGKKVTGLFRPSIALFPPKQSS